MLPHNFHTRTQSGRALSILAGVPTCTTHRVSSNERIVKITKKYI